MAFVKLHDIARVIVNDIEWQIGHNDRKPKKEDYADYFAARRLEARGRGAEARAMHMRKHAGKQMLTPPAFKG